MSDKQDIGGATDPWASSMYYAASVINCDQQRAWDLLLDYRTWNPGLAAAQVEHIAGRRGEEGEIVAIKAVSASGESLPEFCAETVSLVAPRHLVWYVYSRGGDSFRNFLHFSLSPSDADVQFHIYSYARDRLSGEALVLQRRASEAGTQLLATAFKDFCEAKEGLKSAGQPV